ncbi:MAG: peptidylprolyl isomerase, partial [Planctomycetota bacterium]
DDADDAVVVDFRGGSLTLGEVRLLAGRVLAEVPREALQTQIEQHLILRRMPREAEIQGIVDDVLRGHRAWARREVLAVKALAAMIGERIVRPSAEEIERLFRAHPEDYVWPAEYHLAVIGLPVDRDDVRRAYRRGELLVHQLRTGVLTFADAARRHSAHSSAVAGGDVGWVTRWDLTPRFGLDVLKAVLVLNPGERTDLVDDGNFLWIVELRDFRDPRPATLEEARVKIENEIGNVRAETLGDEITAEWLERLAITPATDAEALPPTPPSAR